MYWGRVTHICVSNIIIIGSDNGLSSGRCQAIIWTKCWDILLIGPLGINFSEILIEINNFLFKKMHLNKSSAKWLLFLLDLNELKVLFHYRSGDHILVPYTYSGPNATGTSIGTTMEHVKELVRYKLQSSNQNSQRTMYWFTDGAITYTTEMYKKILYCSKDTLIEFSSESLQTRFPP